MQAEDVRVNDTLLMVNGTNVTINSIYQVEDNVPTYNLGLENSMLMYIAENILVHYLKPPSILLKLPSDDGDNNPSSHSINLSGNPQSSPTEGVMDRIVLRFNLPPVAKITISSSRGTTMTFDGSSSYDLDGAIMSYEWDFGDGTNSTMINPTYTYTVPGEYTVILTVTDNRGAKDTDTNTIYC